MDKKLVEYISKTENGDLIFSFVGFGDWTHFDKIINVVKENIKPVKIEWSGITDMSGYFVKDWLHIDIEYNILGNRLRFRGNKTEENRVKIREWAEIIFESLMNDI